MKKIKNNLFSFIASIVTILIPVIVGMMIYDRLPEQVAMHFDIAGNPDSFYSKGFAVFGVYSFLLVLHLVVSFVTALDNKNGAGIPDKFFGLLIWICPAMSIMMGVVTYGTALGYSIDVPSTAILVIGFLFLILGNYMPKLRINRYAGVRVKWTMESKKNWESTHRFAGWMMCLLGIILIIVTLVRLFIGMSSICFSIISMVLFTIAIGSMLIYPYVYKQKHEKEEDYYNN